MDWWSSRHLQHHNTTCLLPVRHSSLTQGQGFPQVGNVIKALQFRHPATQHEGEEIDEEAGVLTDGEVCFVAHLLEPKQVDRE